MKNYYKVLQIIYDADDSMIDAAYIRIMNRISIEAKKVDLQRDPEFFNNLQTYEAAYDTLRNPNKKEIYDELLFIENNIERLGNKNQTNIELEKRYLDVRCGKSKKTYQCLLARKRNSNGIFYLVDLVASPDAPNSDKSNIKGEEKIASGPFNITLGDIDWGVHICPSCSGVAKNPNGTYATWAGCKECGRIRCVGGIKKNIFGRFSTCPWCGSKNKITRSVPLGKKDTLRLKGFTKE